MPTLEALAQEAVKGSAEAGQDLEQKIKEALACPCLDDIREGPCYKPFSAAFACYVRKYKSDQLEDCYPTFEAMHTCIGNNFDAFAAFYQKEAQLGPTKPS